MIRAGKLILQEKQLLSTSLTPEKLYRCNDGLQRGLSNRNNVKCNGGWMLVLPGDPNVWPLKSPDWYAMHYYVSSVIEQVTKCSPSGKKFQLIDRIMSYCKRFQNTVETVIATKGGFKRLLDCCKIYVTYAFFIKIYF